MKEINFEDLDFDEIIKSTETTLSKISPEEILIKYQDKFCKR
jgi:hypothetical protein